MKLLKIEITTVLEDDKIKDVKDDIDKLLSYTSSYHNIEKYSVIRNFSNKTTIDGVEFKAGTVFGDKKNKKDIKIVYSVGTTYIGIINVSDKYLHEVILRVQEEGGTLYFTTNTRPNLFYYTIVDKNTLVDNRSEKANETVTKNLIKLEECHIDEYMLQLLYDVAKEKHDKNRV